MKNITKTKFSCLCDGLTIRGYEYRPQGEKLPIAIVSHGFMANLMTVKHYAEFLAQMGYVAFCFDFNGGCVMMGQSDGKTTDMSVLTEVSDLCTVIEYAKGLKYTDSTNILLMGCSQGGFVSALTAAKLKNQIKKLTQLGFDKLPICMAKTQYSLSDNPKLLGRPENFEITLSEVRVSAGAGFVVVQTGDIMTMPGLPKKPAAENIDILKNGEIVGLF